MATFLQAGKRITITAAATVAAEAVVALTGMIGVAVTNAASGSPVALDVEGVFELDKTTGETYTQGQKVYWSTATSKITSTASGNIPAGHIIEAAGSAVTTCKVRLQPF